MAVYIAKRLAMALVIVFIVVSLSFFMIRLMPGNPMSALQAQLQMQGGLTPEQIQQKINAIYGVTPTGPLWQQYLTYVGNAFQGDLGRPITNPGTTVVAVIAQALPWTILVVAVSLVISFLVGIAIGSSMAALQNSRFAKVMTFVVSLLSAIPNYLVAIVLLYLLANTWPIFPTGGAYSVDVTPGPNLPYVGSLLYHAILPTAAYVITSFGGWALGMKGSAVSVLGAEYVRAAESRGLSERRITRSYVGRNSMLPMITQLALSVGFMFGGSVFIETYFQYPGVGYYMIQSVNQRDYSLMMGCFLLITISVIVTNLLVDLLYPLVDPRIASPAARKRAADTPPSAAAAGDSGAVPVGGSMA
ncbi:peptide/nickel transport system permease protein [Friedmanniella endophytica]|uniref:Peptide/nickel transport system permease protein n=1 Tax=Microlunatus kandeliicorticis TaxID=1759536 RepID=A0A7W3IQ90_9ACTN|nr:ABC transporter permease [Microlunatus kandeliicorticis]MBA8793190.1 peptide/nickel transport system permease protein [Microlunatus kandeliicorticis]